MRTQNFSRVRGRVPRKARFYQMSAPHAAFRSVLKDIGYEDDDIQYRPEQLRMRLMNDNRAVCRMYVPSFLVVSEKTIYDVNGRLTSDQEEKLATMYKVAGYTFRVVSEADFQSDEYVETEVVSSHES